MIDRLVDRARQLVPQNGRIVLGITGSPGAGKSTLATSLADALDPQGQWVVVVPLDGFHLAKTTLARLGRSDRKGAIDTFDAYGYLSALRRIRSDTQRTVYLPAFHRALEESIGGEIAVDPNIKLVLTEGNYLLAAADPWPDVRREIGEVWYLELDDAVRRERLLARHLHFGRTAAEARRWVDDVDEVNARLIASTRDSADLVVNMGQE